MVEQHFLLLMFTQQTQWPQPGLSNEGRKKGMEFCHIFGYTYYGDKIYGYKKWGEREGKFEMQKYFLSYYPYTLRYDVGHQILFYSAY